MLRGVVLTDDEQVKGGGLARLAFLGAAFTSSWTGMAVAGVKPVDILLAASAVLSLPVLLRRAGGRAPRWVFAGGAAVVITAGLHLLSPTSELYMLTRYGTLGATGRAEQPVVAAFQWLIALTVVPWLGCKLYGRNQRLLPGVGWAWVVGAGVSAAVSLMDYLGVTNVGPSLTGIEHISGRTSGLASHPNNLGIACAIAVPIGIYLSTRRFGPGILALTLLMVGVTTSGSRGAQVGALLAVVLTTAMASQLRRALPLVAYFAAWVCVGLYVAADGVSALFGEMFRFGAGDAAISDSYRARLASQALEDLEHSPVMGVGYDVLTDAHSIYLQILATGGLLLAAGMLIYWIGALRSCWRLGRLGNTFAVCLASSIVLWLTTGIVENQLTDRYLYFPIAIVAALTVRRWAEATRYPPETPARAHDRGVSGRRTRVAPRPRQG